MGGEIDWYIAANCGRESKLFSLSCKKIRMRSIEYIRLFPVERGETRNFWSHFYGCEKIFSSDMQNIWLNLVILDQWWHLRLSNSIHDAVEGNHFHVIIIIFIWSWSEKWCVFIGESWWASCVYVWWQAKCAFLIIEEQA